MKKLKFSKPKKVSLSKLKKETWDMFSKWVRLSMASPDGNVECVTCGRIKNYKEMQAGHFIPGRHGTVLFDERNVHPQCYTCNVVLGGNGPKYYKYMLKRYGQKVIDELENEDRINKQFEFYELETLYHFYRHKLNELL